MTETKWQMWRLTNVTPESSRTPGVHELYDRFNAYRAEIIDGATYVENILDAVLCDALAGTDETHRKRVQATILSAEFFTFFQKWNALRTLLKEQPTWLAEDLPRISDNLRDVHAAIDDRNRFAHGTIAVDPGKMEVVLRYNEGGEQEVAVNEAMIEEVMSRMKSAYFWLEGIHLEFHKVF